MVDGQASAPSSAELLMGKEGHFAVRIHSRQRQSRLCLKDILVDQTLAVVVFAAAMLLLSSCVPGSIGNSRFEGSSCIRGWRGHGVLRKLSAASYILVCRRRSVVNLIRTV
jgi:hypothetical protein